MLFRSVLQAAEPLVGRKLRLKWPNDVFCDGRKLAGVLIDGDGNGNYSIGIGINLNRTRFPRELEAIATSLALVCGRTFHRAALLLDLAQRLETMLQALARGELGALSEQFRDRLGLLGASVCIRAGQDYEGVIESIDLERVRLTDGQCLPLGIVQSIAPR